MNKLILRYDDDLSLSEVMPAISTVINNGKISKSANGDQYCFVTTFTNREKKLVVQAGLTKTGTDTFCVELQ